MVRIVYFSHPEIESLYPLTRKDKPLPNQVVLGKEIAVRVVENIHKSYFREIIVAYPSISERVQEEIMELRGNIRVIEVDPAENACRCLKRVLENLGDSAVVQLGSLLAPPEYYDAFLVRWNEVGGENLISLQPQALSKENKVYSLKFTVEFMHNRIKGVTTEGGEGKYSFSGLIIAGKTFIECLETASSLSEALIMYVKKTEAHFHLWTGNIALIDSPLNLLNAVKILLQRLERQSISSEASVSPTAVIEGPVIVEAGARIDHYSVIKGPAYIGKDAMVGAHSFVRDHVSLEEGAVVGAHAEVKRSYIAPKVLIGSKTYVTDSLVGDGATIRPLTVTLNYDPKEAAKGIVRKMGSIIGEKSIIEGGSVLRPRTVVEPQSVYKL